MHSITNIWKHPRTSIAGLLVSAVTISGVLSQQGITLGTIGGGTVVTLIGTLGTALLGLLARDPTPPAIQPTLSSPQSSPLSSPLSSPQSSTQSSSQARLGVWMLIALLLQLTLVSGCSQSTVARDIVNWTPTLQSAVATADSTAAQLDPKDAPIFIAATTGFDAASNLLVSQARAYLANPSASVLAQMQAQIVTFQQQVNSALLQAARILNAPSRQRALVSIQAVATAVTAILALVQSISSKQAIAQMAAAANIKLAAVLPYEDGSAAAAIVAGHYGEPISLARIQIAQAERVATQAGF